LARAKALFVNVSGCHCSEHDDATEGQPKNRTYQQIANGQPLAEPIPVFAFRFPPVGVGVVRGTPRILLHGVFLLQSREAFVASTPCNFVALPPSFTGLLLPWQDVRHEEQIPFLQFPFLRGPR